MKKALALLGLAGVLISSAASAVTTYSNTLYPAPGGGPGQNWIAAPGVPLNPDPIAVFNDLGVIDDGKLFKLTATNGNIEGYYSFQEPGGPFGNILLGDGYVIGVQDDTEHSYSFDGVDDGLATVKGDVTTMTDMWVSLPGVTGAYGGYHLIGHPFNHNVLFANCKVTDGSETKTVMDAVGSGWLQGYWQYIDAPTQNIMQLDPDEISGSAYMEPGRSYYFQTYKSNLAVIIPAQ